MRLRWATLFATVGLLAACSSPATLDDLSATSYSSTDEVMAELNCSEYIVGYHLGLGVESDAEAVDSVQGEVRANLGVDVALADQRGEHIWVLVNESKQVLAALDSRGGVAMCVRDDYFSVIRSEPLRAAG